MICITTSLAVLIPGYAVSANGQKQNGKVSRTEKSSSTGFLLLARAEKDVIDPGETLNLSLSIKNVSNGVRFILQPIPTEQYRIVVQDERGEPVPLTEYGEKLIKNQEDHISRAFRGVKPGEELKDTIEVNKLYDMAKPGTYSITAWRIVYDKTGHEIGSVRSNTIKVKIAGQVQLDCERVRQWHICRMISPLPGINTNTFSRSSEIIAFASRCVVEAATSPSHALPGSQ